MGRRPDGRLLTNRDAPAVPVDRSGRSGERTMNALVYLLGFQALAMAHDHGSRQPAAPEPALLPIASTPETAGAWRRWAEAGRTPAARAARPKPGLMTRPTTSGGQA
jgi:hypothetical protein